MKLYRPVSKVPRDAVSSSVLPSRAMQRLRGRKPWKQGRREGSGDAQKASTSGPFEGGNPLHDRDIPRAGVFAISPRVCSREETIAGWPGPWLLHKPHPLGSSVPLTVFFPFDFRALLAASETCYARPSRFPGCPVAREELVGPRGARCPGHRPGAPDLLGRCPSPAVGILASAVARAPVLVFFSPTGQGRRIQVTTWRPVSRSRRAAALAPSVLRGTLLSRTGSRLTDAAAVDAGASQADARR